MEDAYAHVMGGDLGGIALLYVWLPAGPHLELSCAGQHSRCAHLAIGNSSRESCGAQIWLLPPVPNVMHALLILALLPPTLQAFRLCCSIHGCSLQLTALFQKRHIRVVRRGSRRQWWLHMRPRIKRLRRAQYFPQGIADLELGQPGRVRLSRGVANEWSIFRFEANRRKSLHIMGGRHGCRQGARALSRVEFSRN